MGERMSSPVSTEVEEKVTFINVTLETGCNIPKIGNAGPGGNLKTIWNSL